MEILADESNNIEEIADGQLYMLQEIYHTVFDVNGDVRWYLGEKYTTNVSVDYSNALPLSPDKDGLWISYNPCTGWVYNNNCELIYMNWMGKVLKMYSAQNENSDHDATLLPDGSLLYYSHGVLNRLDTTTGEFSEYLDMADLFDSSVGNINPENAASNPTDWAHANTVEYISDNNSLLLSLRNQHLVVNIDYETKEIIWAMTPAYSVVDDEIVPVQAAIKNTIVVPDEADTDFEWFYSQHDPSFISYDADNQIFEFVMFDNGTHRYLTDEEPNNLKYSRIVHYVVDLKDRTVSQKMQYGKEEGAALYSPAYGSAEIIPQSGHYLGNFRGHNATYPEKSIIVEVDETGEVVAKYIAYTPGNNWGTYRANALFLGDQSFSNCNFGENPGYMHVQYDQVAWEETNSPTLSAEQFSVFQQNELYFDDQYLYIYGTAMVENSTNTVAHEIVAVNSTTGISYQYTVGTAKSAEGQFYGRGIPLDSLPDGQYLLYVRGTNGNGKTASIFTGYQLTLGCQQEQVPVQDILQTQNDVNETLTNACTSGNYTLDYPLISVDPYGIAPLSAIVTFTTEQPATVSLTVEGKYGAAPLTQQFETMTTEHQIPVYGLYEEEAATVTLNVQYQDGSTDSTTLSIMGNALPDDFVPVEVEQADTTQMADGWTFLMAGSLQGYVYAIDEAGSVRWMLSEKGLGAASVFLPLENGNYLIGGDKSFGNYYKYNLFELNLSGQIIHEYLIDGYHHDAVELPSGNLLLLANNVNGQVMEDTIYELDRETGEILRTWDFNGYFDVGNYDASGQHIADINYGTGTSDWLHINGIDYDAQTDSLLISSRHQDAVISMNLTTSEINWILSDPNDLWPEYLSDKLLTPVGDNFEWQYGQHNAIWLPNGDVMLFDNGDYRSKTPEGILDPATEAYSRAVIYHIDAQTKTVSQVWEFGKDKGTDHFAVNVSSVQYLGENHYLIDFGGIVKNSAGEATYSIMDGITGSSRSEVYEIKNGEVIFHASVERQGLHGNTFRAVRLVPYETTQELDLSIQADRLGSLYSYGLATTVSFTPESTVDGTPDVSVTDNGVQLLFDGTLDQTADELAVIFYGVQATYRVALPSGASISYTLNKSEIPVGTYQLYLVEDDVVYDLALEWTNTMAARAYPTGYDVEVTTSSDGKGTVYGSGTYYANTSFTVSVNPASGAEFIGWYFNGTLLSTEETYTLTATQDMTLVATFAGDESTGGDVGDGGSGGGIGGGGAIGGGVGSGGDTTEVVNPDGSTTTTTINADGSKSETTTAPNGVTTVVNTDQKGKAEAEATVPSDVVNSAAEKGETVLLPMPALTATSDKADAPTVAVELPDGITVALEIPVDNVTSSTVAILISADGSEKILKTCVASENGLIVDLSNGDKVQILDNAKTFSDVPDDYWGADAIAFVTSRELFSGTGQNRFSPESNMSRAMIVTVLARLEGVDTSDSSPWYESGRQWAMKAGISDGTNMDGSLTREQLAAMLYRYAGSPSVSGTITGFTDVDSISDWALDAMTWAVNSGILNGSKGALKPQAPATRAQVAAMLQRFVENVM